MQIRKIKKSEIAAVTNIIRLNYHKRYARMARKELDEVFKNNLYDQEYFVAIKYSELLGFVAFCQSAMSYNVYEIFWVNVSPKYQKKGIGTQLVKKAIQHIKQKKGIAKRAQLIILTTAKPKFYKRLGFKSQTKFGKKHQLMALALRSA